MPDANSVSATADISWQQTWGSSKFIEQWAAKDGWQAPIREVQTAMVLRMIPHSIEAPVRILDIGAGYGALAAAVLDDRPMPLRCVWMLQRQCSISAESETAI